MCVNKDLTAVDLSPAYVFIKHFTYFYQTTVKQTEGEGVFITHITNSLSDVFSE